MSSVADNRTAIILETSPGVQVTTPAWLTVPTALGDEINFEFDTAESFAVLSNRAMQGVRRVTGKGSGTLKTPMLYGGYMDVFIQSALSNATASSVTKGGSTDKYFNYERTMFDSSTIFARRLGGIVQKFGLKADLGSVIECSWDVLAFGAPSTAAAIVTGATYTAIPSGLPMNGNDITAFTTTGLTTPQILGIDLSVETDRTVQNYFGSLYGRGVGSGKRKVSLDVSFWRADVAPETAFLLNDVNQSVTFDVGTAGNGYRIQLPNANVSAPQGAMESNSNIVKLTFTATNDNTTGTDIVITKL